ncbi:beta-defensin 103A-like [Tachyglossus aculeatus]|uniref:beta-defensin 103A-like n=1 Tax=Tachyglossus aculeatus TaxID=9261 RepID=UPI0018F2F1FE|nr:beta-defensin 103A-like [Tachyglossus aculeatus]
MRLHYLLFAIFFLFLIPAPGDGRLLERINNLYCRVRRGRCRLLGCFPKEEQVGTCSLGRRKCCRKRT